MVTKEKYSRALNSCSPFRKRVFREYYSEILRKPHCITGKASIITDEEFKEYVNIFVEYDMGFKKFPSDHPRFPNMPMARTIRDYFDFEAKIHGFEKYEDFAKWKYTDGPWKPSGQLYYMDINIVNNEKEEK